MRHLFPTHFGSRAAYYVAVVETLGGKAMVRFRSNVMSIFVASALVLFMSPVKNAFAHPASPAVAKAFSAQEPKEGPEKAEVQDIQDDMDEGPDSDVDANEGPDVEEMDAANHDAHETDADRAEDQLEDAHDDVVTAPPAA
jgi:midasin (ATPase involved in ribosome maturation)